MGRTDFKRALATRIDSKELRKLSIFKRELLLGERGYESQRTKEGFVPRNV